MNFVYDALLLVAVITPLVLIALWTTRPRTAAPAVLFLALLALDTLITPLEYALGMHPPGLQWNWMGKAASLAWALLFVALGPLTAREVGLTLRQRRGSVLPAAVFTIVLIAATAILSGAADEPATTETLLYQATMPGFAEELAMRGVFLALLHRAFSGIPLRGNAAHAPVGPDAPRWRGARIWPALITSVAFGLWHGLSVQNGAIRFDAMSFLLPFIGGMAFAWLRERTDSLLFPVLAHNGANLIHFFLPR